MSNHKPLAKPDVSHVQQRSELLRTIRSFFEERSFHEVQPPCLMRECIVDVHIEPIRVLTQQFSLPGVEPNREFYLQSSPELAMKRMLAADSGSIYSICPVFRAGESGQQHSLEFTMLEWYEVGADLSGGISTLGELATRVLDVSDYEVVNYCDLFTQYLSVDPIDVDLASLHAIAAGADAELAKQIVSQDQHGKDHHDKDLAGQAVIRDDLLDLCMSELIQPRLGASKPLIVKNYPLSQAALAKQSVEDDRCAARFELFVDGVELANGYDELLCPDELMQRYQKIDMQRSKLGLAPIDPPISLVQAMQDGIPPAAGVAMGVDRLLMVMTGCEISQAIPFLINQA